jgi:hypothetical protein
MMTLHDREVTIRYGLGRAAVERWKQHHHDALSAPNQEEAARHFAFANEVYDKAKAKLGKKKDG